MQAAVVDGGVAAVGDGDLDRRSLGVGEQELIEGCKGSGPPLQAWVEGRTGSELSAEVRA